MTATDTPRGTRGAGGRGRSLGVVLLVVLAAVVVLALLGRALDLSLPNPFAETQREHPNAVVLAELRDQSRYVAASARFQTLIDSEEDADYLPDVLKGSRSIFIAEGDVDAYTDFSRLTEDAIEVSAEGDVVTIHVPPVELGPPRLDTDATRLVSRDRGLLDRLGDALGGGDPANQQALYQRAEDKIAEAAARSELSRRAEENTATFLRSLFEGMGYREVRIVVDGPGAGDR